MNRVEDVAREEDVVHAPGQVPDVGVGDDRVRGVGKIEHDDPVPAVAGALPGDDRQCALGVDLDVVDHPRIHLDEVGQHGRGRVRNVPHEHALAPEVRARIDIVAPVGSGEGPQVGCRPVGDQSAAHHDRDRAPRRAPRLRSAPGRCARRHLQPPGRAPSAPPRRRRPGRRMRRSLFASANEVTEKSVGTRGNFRARTHRADTTENRTTSPVRAREAPETSTAATGFSSTSSGERRFDPLGAGPCNPHLAGKQGVHETTRIRRWPGGPRSLLHSTSTVRRSLPSAVSARA